MSNKLQYHEIENIVNQFGYKLINIGKKLIFSDDLGYIYCQNLWHLKNGHKPKIADYVNPYSIENIKLWLKLNKKNFELLSTEFINHKTKLYFKCSDSKCGEIFDYDWIHLSTRNFDCPYCSGSRVGLSNCLATKNPELASEWHLTKNGDLTPYDITCGSKKEVWWQCKNNPKHEWQATINNRIASNSGCPYCSHHLPSEDYNLLLDNPQLCEEWDYKKNKKSPEEYCPQSNQHVWWLCKECGHKWYASINARNGNCKTGCPECSESKGEKTIRNWLRYKNITFISQKEFEGLIGLGGGNLSYDFYLPQYNLLIEFQGIQHEKYIKGLHKSKKDFKKQQEHDKRKKEYALHNKYNFLEIWYYDFDRIEEILLEKLNSIELVGDICAK